MTLTTSRRLTTLIDALSVVAVAALAGLAGGREGGVGHVGGAMSTVAALYVDPKGAYAGLEGVEVWDQARDARRYDGPWPVVAHPPCERWGRYWGGGPMLHGTPRQKRLGDDGGCFAAALAAVRRWGGVLEHPEASHAWRVHGLFAPPREGGWVRAGDLLGWTCCVEQGHYGHRARKATWLYAVGAALPDLTWGAALTGVRLEPGFHSREERARSSAERRLVKRLSARERAATPPAFRDLLLSLARSARRSEAA